MARDSIRPAATTRSSVRGGQPILCYLSRVHTLTERWCYHTSPGQQTVCTHAVGRRGVLRSEHTKRAIPAAVPEETLLPAHIPFRVLVVVSGQARHG